MALMGLLMCLRIAALGTEQVSLHGLGKQGAGALASMVVAFGGAACVLWGVAAAVGQAEWVGGTIWSGALYTAAFGLYTAALAAGPVSTVSPWTNATIVLLWLIRPTGGVWSILGMALFVYGAWKSVSGGRISRPVLWMLAGDAGLVCARFWDAARAGNPPPLAYAASQYLSISLWMCVLVVATDRWRDVWHLASARTGWSVAAAASNATAYATLFALLQWLPPAVVEAASSLAGLGAAFVGALVFHEPQPRSRVAASIWMTVGALVLLADHAWHLHA